jgi:uncharacterized membrane protein YbaN (DUF454 family)
MSGPSGTENRAVRAGWVFMGSLALGIGIIGIPLPVLPTAPFLLAALYCYSRGSARCYDWLRQNRVLSPFIVSGEAGMSQRMRLGMVLLVWAACVFSLLIFAKESWQQATVLAVGLAMTAYLLLWQNQVKVHPSRPKGR